jgi:hypothetical protein
MYCPKCGYQYNDGFYECSDCEVPLVPEPPSETKPHFTKYKEVASNLRRDQIIIIKSILEARGIVYFVQGESFGTICAVPSAIRLLVQESQYNEALKLLEDFI